MLVQTYVHGASNKRSEVHKDQHGDYEVRHYHGGNSVNTKKFGDSGQAHDHAKKLVKEDAPINSAGNGGVQGIGVGPKGEPGGKKAKLIKTILKRRKPVL